MVKLNKKKLLSLITTLIILCSGCILNEHEDYTLDFKVRIVNNSEHKITWYRYSYSDSGDSSLLEQRPSLVFRDHIIAPTDEGFDVGNVEDTKSGFEAKYIIRYFIFANDSIETIPWSVIRQKHIVAKTVTFNTYKEIENANFTINYP